MIVQRLDSSLLLITQADHAALAERIMTAWRADGFPGRPTRSRVLEAIRLHDIGWQNADAAPLILPTSAMPCDVIQAPLDQRQGVWPHALDQLAPRDPYIAALVAHHAWTVYRRFASTPEWMSFFAEMERRRDDYLATVDIDRDRFLEDYAIVGMGDRWSLIFCFGWQEPNPMGAFRAQLHPGAGSVDGGWLEITPDPFDGAAVPLDVQARSVPARRYESDDDLRDTLSRAPIVHLTGVASGPRTDPTTFASVLGEAAPRIIVPSLL
jgi:hypothetical protein